MPEPYRTAARPDPTDPTLLCDLCRAPFLPVAEGIDVCDVCLRKACRAVQEMAKKRPKPREAGPVRFLAPAILVGAFSFLTFALLTTMNAVVDAKIAATQALLASQKTRGQEKPPKKKPMPPAAPKPPAAPLQPALPEIPAITSLLAPLRPEVHNPEALLDRVAKLRASGFDITVTRSYLGEDPLPSTESVLQATGRIAPVRQDGKIVGIRVTKSPFLDLQEDDFVLSINGYSMDSPESAFYGYGAAQHHNAAIVELIRHGRRVVLDLRWK